MFHRNTPHFGAMLTAFTVFAANNQASAHEGCTPDIAVRTPDKIFRVCKGFMDKNVNDPLLLSTDLTPANYPVLPDIPLKAALGNSNNSSRPYIPTL